MVRSGVIVLASDLAFAAVGGLVFTSGLRVGTSLHGIKNGFHDGEIVIFCQILLPTMLGRSRFTNMLGRFPYWHYFDYFNSGLIRQH